MSTLTDFLLARIAEDEGRCRDLIRREPPMEGARPGVCHPVRMLAECEAKLRILGMLWYPGETGEPIVREYARLTLELMARPYAGHPDYRDEWRP